MESRPDLAAALAAVQGCERRFHTASDDELLADGAAIEAIGRLIDAHRIAFAGEVGKRSEKRRGEDSLAFRHGARDASELVAQVALVGTGTARTRVGLGAALAPRVSLTGDLLPGRFPHLAAAIDSGEISVDAARLVAQLLQQVRGSLRRGGRSKAEIDALLDGPELELAAAAAHEPFGQLRFMVETWRGFLDPDGTEPTAAEAWSQRAFRIGAIRADGTATFSGTIGSAAQHALIVEALQSRRRVGPFVRTPDGGDDEGEHEDLDGEWRQADDDRTRTQQDYDTVLELLTAGLEAEAAGTASTATTHEIVIHASAQDLAERRGAGWTDGLLGRLSIPTVERIACSAGVRVVITGDRGEILHLGRSERLFSAAQKKALNADAGGFCQIPGCTARAPFLQAHHAAWFHRDEGPTDIGNGIMVCSHHHHLLHAKHPPFELRKHEDRLFLVPPRWKGPPEPRQRIRTGIHVAPGDTKTTRPSAPGGSDAQRSCTPARAIARHDLNGGALGRQGLRRSGWIGRPDSRA